MVADEFYGEFPIDEEFGFSVWVLLGLYAAIWSAISLYAYILDGMAFHRMGKVCGAAHPWLAWIPFANAYAMGYVADKDAQTSGRFATHYRYMLPILTVVNTVVWTAALVAMGWVVISSAMDVLASDPSLGYEPALGLEPIEAPTTSIRAGTVGLMGLLFLIGMVLLVALDVFRYIALWHVYRLFDPNNAVVFLLLSIFVSIVMPIVLFIASRKTPTAFAQHSGGTPGGTDSGNGSNVGNGNDNNGGGAYFFQ